MNAGNSYPRSGRAGSGVRIFLLGIGLTVVLACHNPASAQDDSVLLDGSWMDTAFPDVDGDSLTAADEGLVAVDFQLEQTMDDFSGSRFEPTAGFGVAYDDNIFLRENNREGDFIYTVTAGANGAWGEREDNATFIFDYDATLYLYQNNGSQNGLNHELDLEGGYRWNKLRVASAVSYSYLTTADREVGGFANRHEVRGGLEATYDLTGKTTIGIETGYAGTFYEGNFLNDTATEGTLFVDWAATQKTSIGVGFSFAFNTPEGSPTQTYQTVELRWKYEASEKLRISANGGVSFRQYGTRAPASTGFVFDLRADWEPTPYFLAALRAYRDENSSPTQAGENFTATGFEVIAQQRFFGVFVFDLVGGYEFDSYQSVSLLLLQQRDDHYFFVRPTLTWQLSQRLTLGIYYEYRQTISNSSGDSFYENRVGLDANFLF